MDNRQFGTTAEGTQATLYTIENGCGMRAQVTDFGATVVSLIVKDKAGKDTDVVLGYDDVASYQKQACYFGATVGRNCNRIADAKIVIDGVTYELEANDNENNLHSGSKGSSERFWKVKDYTDSRITFQLEDAHLTQGYPGNATMEVTYELTPENELAISYHAVSDKKTVFNFTNHAYYNLNGHASGDILGHTLQINASGYTPVKDAKAIPTGEVAPVEGTPFDFRKAKPVGQDIRADHVQLSYGNGYDHNFALDRGGVGMETAAVACGEKSGIRMEVITDCIGIQLYTANFIGGQQGKGGITYPNNGAMCLETQFFPNSINEPNFVSPLTNAGVPYESKTVYRFSIA